MKLSFGQTHCSCFMKFFSTFATLNKANILKCVIIRFSSVSILMIN